MSEDEDKKNVPQVIAVPVQAPPASDNKPVVGRTVWDLIHESESGPKLDKAMSRVADFAHWGMDVVGDGWTRVKALLGTVEEKLTAKGVEPKPIPERVGVPVVQAVVLEEREEIRELWANLLVSAATGEEVDEFHIGIVKQLSPDAALALRVAVVAHYSAGPTPSTEELADVSRWNMQRNVREHPELLRVVPDLLRRGYALDRLSALGLLKTTHVPAGCQVLSLTGHRLVHLVVDDPRSLASLSSGGDEKAPDDNEV